MFDFIVVYIALVVLLVLIAIVFTVRRWIQSNRALRENEVNLRNWEQDTCRKLAQAMMQQSKGK